MQIVLSISILIGLASSNVYSLLDVQERLMHKLFLQYDKNLRPPGVVKIKFGMHLNQIIQLIEKEQNILLNVFIDHEWKDKRLAWNPSEFGNLTSLRISSDQVWTY